MGITIIPVIYLELKNKKIKFLVFLYYIHTHPLHYIHTQLHPKCHIAGNLLDQNQIIPFNTWVCLCHDSNTARNQKQNDIKGGIGM